MCLEHLTNSLEEWVMRTKEEFFSKSVLMMIIREGIIIDWKIHNDHWSKELFHRSDFSEIFSLIEIDWINNSRKENDRVSFHSTLPFFFNNINEEFGPVKELSSKKKKSNEQRYTNPNIEKGERGSRCQSRRTFFQALIFSFALLESRFT